jgi:hypothetical protein
LTNFFEKNLLNICPLKINGVSLQKKIIMRSNPSVLLGSPEKKLMAGIAVLERHNPYRSFVQPVLPSVKKNKIQLLQKELELGENSPMVENFDFQNHLAQLHEKYT